ncbi:hypothetical protein [Pleionea mediterranea]|uniref:Uncharacterized protein n=1 Tax=Pleionea mediterranea TaxID=523701 RepID=A0A316FDY9_9GAMM|nr:hypothetical protein [Pleionea mediterranea]PWK46345.1 hypothetical protein C8D97_11328 [Pleionea mediterranea]
MKYIITLLASFLVFLCSFVYGEHPPYQYLIEQEECDNTQLKNVGADIDVSITDSNYVISASFPINGASIIVNPKLNFVGNTATLSLTEASYSEGKAGCMCTKTIKATFSVELLSNADKIFIVLDGIVLGEAVIPNNKFKHDAEAAPLN